MTQQLEVVGELMPERSLERGQLVAAVLPGLDRDRQCLALRLLRSGGQQVVLRREVAVDRGQGDTGPTGHSGYGKLVERTLGEEVENGAKDRAPGQLPLLCPQAHEMIVAN